MGKLLLPLAVAVSLSGCTTWGAKAPTGDHRYAAVPPDHVQLLFHEPTRPYVQVGIVSSLGGWYTPDADNYRKVQREAAELGAGAVILSSSPDSDRRSFWQYPKQTGIAIKYTN